MKSATDLYRNRIGLIFDFDGTLGGSTFESVLKHLEFDPDAFTKEHVDPLLDSGWELPLAQAFALELISRGEISRPAGSDEPITAELLQQVGRDMKLFDGASEMFDAVRHTAHQEDEELEVEFYLLTAGFAEVVKGTSIAGEFRRIYGGAYHFHPRTGGIDAAKRLVTHPEKPRYILQICKGKDLDRANPTGADESLDRSEWRLPMDQIIYVGDGLSDIPAFEIVSERGGIALGVVGVDDETEWKARKRLHTDRVVANLASADYREDSELLRSLILAVQSIARRVAIRRLSRSDDRSAEPAS